MPSEMTPENGPLAGRIALITGASRGIGAAVARRFAREGAHLVLVARSQAGLEELDDDIRAECGEDAAPTLVPMDLSDTEKLDQLGAAIAHRFGKLDILVGNAGVLGTLTPTGQIDPEEWDEVMAVNLTANWRLIRMFDPALRASDTGRAMFVTSSAARGVPYWGTYAVSKAGLDSLVKTWAGETSKTNMRVNIIDPGSTRTGMRAKAFPGEDPMSLKTPEDITQVFVDLASPDCKRHGEVVKAY